MRPPIDDTSPAIQRLLIEGYRKMTPQQKLERVDELNKAVQHLALVRIKAQYGEISERANASFGSSLAG